VLGESDAPVLLNTLNAADRVRLSAPNRTELLLVVKTRLGDIGVERALASAERHRRHQAHEHCRLRDVPLRADVRSIQDIARSVDIVRETERGDEVPNEIDVVSLAENRLYLVECKTRSRRGEGLAGAGADALYRLDTLGDSLGGLQARAILVSDRKVQAHELRRAVDLGIRVGDGKRLPELAADLREWIPHHNY